MTLLQRQILAVLKRTRRVMSSGEIAAKIPEVSATGVVNSLSFYRGDEIIDLTMCLALMIPNPDCLKRKYWNLKNLLEAYCKEEGKDENGLQRCFVYKTVKPGLNSILKNWYAHSEQAQKVFSEMGRETQIAIGGAFRGSELSLKLKGAKKRPEDHELLKLWKEL